jgi:hypothetical protein
MWDTITFRRARDHRYPWRKRVARVGAAALLIFLLASYPSLTAATIVPAIVTFMGFYLLIAGEIDMHLRARESRRLIDGIRDKYLAEKEARADARMAEAKLAEQKARKSTHESFDRVHRIVAAGMQQAAEQRARIRDMYLEEHEKLRASTLAAIKHIEDQRRRDGEGWKRP